MVFPYKWFKFPFAVAGDLAAVPNGVQGDGSVSYTQGYGPDYSLDPATQPAALNVERNKQNQLFNDITTALQYIQSGQIPAWVDATTNGGSSYSYSKNALVVYTDNNIYISLVNGNTVTPGTDPTSWGLVSLAARTLLTANTTFYVDIAGNDTTGAGTAGAPWRTAQHAADVLKNRYDLNGYIATIYRNASTAYTDAVNVSGAFVGASSAASVVFDGAGLASVTVNASVPYQFLNGAQATVQNQKLIATTNCIISGYLAQVNYKNIDFGTAGTSHLIVAESAFLTAIGNYQISGSTPIHASVGLSGFWNCSNITVTLVGVPNFSTAFLLNASCGNVISSNVTWSPNPLTGATGVKYNVSSNSVTQTSGTGAGANYFPGGSAGTSGSGAQYF